MENQKTKELNIYQRMLMATSEINRVAKNLKITVSKTSSYKAVAESDVLDAVKPIEELFGIYSYPYSRDIVKDELYTTSSTWDGKTTEKNSFFMRIKTIYRFVNVDKPIEFIDIATYGDGVDSQDKAPGKAMTYSDKYALLKAYKIHTGEDPDASASGSFSKKPKVVEKPTAEQLMQADELNINMNNLAVHLKCNVDEIATEDLVNAIIMKQNALEKHKQAIKTNTTSNDEVKLC